jgi:hypothetical protein
VGSSGCCPPVRLHGAGTALGQAQTAQAPTDFTAQFTPDQLSTFKSMLGYANGNQTPAQTAAAAATNMANGTSATTGALNGLGLQPERY